VNKPEKSDPARFLTSIGDAGLQQHIDKPTHRYSLNTLDLLISRPEDSLVIDSDVFDILNSVHLVVNCTIAYAKPERKTITSNSRDFRNLDSETFARDLVNSLRDFPYEGSLDHQVDFYNMAVLSALDEHCPVTLRTHKFKFQPAWYTDEIHLARRNRRRLERKWSKSGNPDDHRLYLDEIHAFSKLVRASKTTYYMKQLDAADNKTVFRTMNTLLNKNAIALPYTDSMKHLCDRFSSFFTDKIVRIRDKINSNKDVDVPTLVSAEPVPVPEICDFKLVDDDELRKIICRSPNKQCTFDPLPTWLVKQNLNILMPVFTSIVNTSLSKGTFPTALKEAVVTPLLKKPTMDKDTLKNYRPVSNIAFLSKIIEKAVLSRVSEHVDNCNLHRKFQSAYRSGHSTETALLRVKSDIVYAIDNRQAVFVVLLDLSAAFDTIDHNVLLNRLCTVFGFKNNVISWFKTYLCNRICRIKIANDFSDPTVLHYGIPQGSCVGPQMFSYYTHPITDIILRHSGVKFHFYADDSQLYVCVDPWIPGETERDLAALSNCISDIKTWMSNNMLCLNEEKTEFFVAASPRLLKTLTGISITIGSTTIHPSSTVRNLGVELDNVMTMSQQVTAICKTINFHLWNLSRVRIYINETTCHHAIRALVTSRLDYANSLLQGCSGKELNRLQRLQNKAAKLIFMAKKHDHATPLLRQLHWLPVRERIEFKTLTFVFKCLSDSAPSYVTELVIPYQSNRSGLRSGSDSRLLATPRTHLCFSDKGFYAAAPKLWNILPFHIRHATSLSQFKSTLKTHLF